VRQLAFHRPRTLDELLELKARLGANGLLLAGGTDLILALREPDHALSPAEVIDMSALAELRSISVDQATGDTCVGALVTHTQLTQDLTIRATAPLLSQAAAAIGSPQIRNRGTLGGNICNASPCADTLPPLVALGAQLTLRSVRGARAVGVFEAIPAPHENALAPDELLTEIRFPPIPSGVGCAFVKLGRRKALSISRMSIAVILPTAADGRIHAARVAAGSVAPTPRRFAKVEAELDGKGASQELFALAGKVLAGEMIAQTGRRWSTPYKEPVVAALLKRALVRASQL
jgi:CO/xanthine dehydrogenase FAD-binding subunit